jgi:hypothetical protein
VSRRWCGELREAAEGRLLQVECTLLGRVCTTRRTRYAAVCQPMVVVSCSKVVRSTSKVAPVRVAFMAAVASRGNLVW